MNQPAWHETIAQDWQDITPEGLSSAFLEAMGGADPETMMMRSMMVNAGPSIAVPLMSSAGGATAVPYGATAVPLGAGGMSGQLSRGSTGSGSMEGAAARARMGMGGRMGMGALGAAGLAAMGRSASGGLSASAVAAAVGGSTGGPMVVPVVPRGGAAAPTAAALAAMPVWEKAAVLQQAIRESWPGPQMQTVLSSLSDDEIAAIRTVHAQKMQTATVPQSGGRPGRAGVSTAHAAMDALMTDAVTGATTHPSLGAGESGDADAIIDAAVLEAAAGVNVAGASPGGAHLVTPGLGGSGKARGGVRGPEEEDEHMAFALEGLRSGSLLGDAGGSLALPLGSPTGGGMAGAAGGVEKSFDSLSLPSIHDAGELGNGWRREGGFHLRPNIRRHANSTQVVGPPTNPPAHQPTQTAHQPTQPPQAPGPTSSATCATPAAPASAATAPSARQTGSPSSWGGVYLHLLGMGMLGVGWGWGYVLKDWIPESQTSKSKRKQETDQPTPQPHPTVTRQVHRRGRRQGGGGRRRGALRPARQARALVGVCHAKPPAGDDAVDGRRRGRSGGGRRRAVARGQGGPHRQLW
jgi:hypothetical protein